MARMSQKELLEEGFSDMIRGAAKAAATGIKQAAQQGVRLDTGQLAKGMTKSYQEQQPVAVLKAKLAGDPSIEIVKIDKSNIKKQQASGEKGYIGRIVGPKSITLIPFRGVLYSKDERQYKGEGAGTIKEARAAMGYGSGTRTKEGQYKPVSKKGAVESQITNSLVKSGVEERSAKRLAAYISRNMKTFLGEITENRPQIKFSYKGQPILGVADIPDEEAEDFSDYDKMGRKKFIASLDDEVIISLIKTLQEAQPGYEIEFTEEGSKRAPSDYAGEEGMFVAEVFRTKKGLEVGSIYRQGDPKAVVWPNKHTPKEKKEKEVKLSPFDKTIEEFKTKNLPITATSLATKLNLILDPKLKIEVSDIVSITGVKENVKLLDKDIEQLKAQLIAKGTITEGTSQKNLLRQLTSLLH